MRKIPHAIYSGNNPIVPLKFSTFFKWIIVLDVIRECLCIWIKLNSLLHNLEYF